MEWQPIETAREANGGKPFIAINHDNEVFVARYSNEGRLCFRKNELFSRRPGTMLFGRTHLHEFTRDDGSISVIEFKRAPYSAGNVMGPPEFCEPPEGGEIEEWEVDSGMTTLTEAEAERAEREMNALPFDPSEDDDYYST